jgi:hypothetical protein
MSELDQALDRIRSHDGVEHVLVLRPLDADTVSAMVPGVAQAAASLGAAAGLGAAATVVVRLDEGVAVVQGLSPEVLLAVLLRGNVGFAPLLRELGQGRDELAALV